MTRKSALRQARRMVERCLGDAIAEGLVTEIADKILEVERKTESRMWLSIASNCEIKSSWWEMTQKPGLARAYAKAVLKPME